MKNQDNRLTVFKNTEDISLLVKDFDQNYTLTLSNTDTFYIGYRKNLFNLYIEVITPNTIATPNLKVSRWNGTGWVVMKIEDETFGLKKAGYLKFDYEDNETVKQTINGVENCYYKVEVLSNTVIYGIGMIFCSLKDLRKEEPAIEKFFPQGYKTHILSQKLATDYILDSINMIDSGEYVCKCGNVPFSKFNEYDLVFLNELNMVATYYTLYKIFSNRSDSDNQDEYSKKSDQYYAKYETRLRVFTGRQITLDENNDGKFDPNSQCDTIRKVYIKW